MGPPQSPAKPGPTRQRLTKCMTPSQLERKRRIDRDNQRAVRARAKARTEELEQAVEQLNRQLQKSEERACAVIREKESSVITSLHPSQNILYTAVPETIASTDSTLDTALVSKEKSALSGSGQDESDAQFGVQNVGSSGIGLHESEYYSSAMWQDTHEFPKYGSIAEGGMEGEDNLSFIYNDNPEILFALNHPTSFQDETQTSDLLQPSRQLGQNFSNLSMISMLGIENSTEQEEVVTCNQTSSFDNVASSPISSMYFEQQTHQWALFPRRSAPTCLWDRTINSMISQGLQLKAGTLRAELSSPIATIVSSILCPTTAPRNFPLLSLVVRQVVTCFEQTLAWSQPLFIAAIYIVYTLIRWEVLPSQESYGCIPAWMKPDKRQLEKPHAPWIDTFLWPNGRRKLVELFDPPVFDSFSELFLRNISINWPYDAGSIVIRCPRSKTLSLNPVYEQHITSLKNWTVEKSVAERAPLMAGLFNESPSQVLV